MALASFGAGCFWGVESAFRKVQGIKECTVGYMGGNTPNPTYHQVCRGDTGHAEVVQVEYDPALLSYEELLKIFWKIHDPTTLNRQGPDRGTQYRSVIFYYTPEQHATALAVKNSLTTTFTQPIVTAIEPAGSFYRAEEYHQRYFEKQGKESSCRIK